MKAAFINIGQEHNAFLHFSDIAESNNLFKGVIEVESDDEENNSHRNSNRKGFEDIRSIRQRSFD